MKILIVAPSWVGDTVLSQPLFRRLHQLHSGLIIDVLSPQWTAPVLKRMPQVRRVISNPFNHRELRLVDRWKLANTLKSEHYQQAIVLPNSLKSALIPWFAGIPQRTGFVGEARYGILNDARRLDKQALPLMVERFAQLAESKGKPLHRPIARPHIEISSAECLAVTHSLGLDTAKPVAAFCVGAEYGPAKRWPPHYFAELAKRMHQRGYAVWLIGSAKDVPIGAEVYEMYGKICIDLCGKTNLNEAMALLAHASLVVTNDSGLMHVAAALNKPMIALYGSSSPGFTPPLSDNAKISYLHLSCSPCFQRVCPLGHFNCMLQMTPESIDREVISIVSAE